MINTLRRGKTGGPARGQTSAGNTGRGLVIEECGDVQHEIMLKLLFYTAIRVSELVRIETTDVDLDHCKIFIDRGKGNKDRYILFPESFRLVLKSHLKTNPKNYLFE